MNPQTPNPNYQPAPAPDPNAPYTPAPTPPQQPPAPYGPPGVSVSPVTSVPPPKGLNKRLLIILFGGVLVLLIIVIVAIMLLAILHKPPKKSAPATVPTALCFVRLEHLDCVDGEGQNRVRYNVPDLPENARITALVPNSDQSRFLAISPAANNTSNVWILNAHLQQQEELQIPSGDSATDPSWSRNGQSILLEIDGAGGSQEIDSYNLASNSLQQLTTSGLNAQPYQTEDGHILYDYNGGAGWQPYIMNSDGSNPIPLANLSSLSKVAGFSYDPPTDTVFVYGDDQNDQPAITYATASDFMNGRVTHTLDAPVVGSDDQIGFVTSSTIVVAHDSVANILDLSQINAAVTVTQFGNLVGVIKVGDFQRSAQQTEQADERIINLPAAPSDFQTYIEQQFVSGNQACQASNSAQAAGYEFIMDINQVVNDNFAYVVQGCGTSDDTYYAKDTSSGDWTVAFATQNTPTCAQVNQFAYTSQIIPQCYGPDPQTGAQELMPNNNP